MTKKIFLIAGEASGDALGASLMRALKLRAGADIELIGVGGPEMESEGLESLLPMAELTVMGIWEAVSHLPRLIKLRNGLVEEIEKQEPDAVVTIDFPDFNFQVASQLKKRGKSKAKLVHYVAPTVWAWRPGRAKIVSAFLDGMLCLFPFEPDHFKPHGLDAVFVGHPLIENKIHKDQGMAFRRELGIPDGAKTLGVLFGSREEEFKKMADTLRDTMEVLLEKYGDIHIIIPTLKHMEYNVAKAIEGIKASVYVVSEPGKKWKAFAACDVALAVSGTAGLELAYLGIPHVVVYKMHPVSALLARFLVKVKYAHLANILLEKRVVPEFLQSQCEPIRIAAPLLKMLKNTEEGQKQITELSKVRELLVTPDGKTPSENAAEFVLGKLQ